MKIGIHSDDTEDAYSKSWIQYCITNKIDYKIVNAYDSDIVCQLQDCDIFMWHFLHYKYKDMLFAKQLIASLQEAGKTIFPNIKTCWHFDDKLGQKYLFEANQINYATAYVFYDKQTALNWIQSTSFPKIFKLRGGASSSNVLMARNKREAKQYIQQSFSKGWKYYSGKRHFTEQIKFFKHGKASLLDVLKAFGRVFITSKNYKMMPVNRGYVYFQDYIPTDGFDYRLEICGEKCIAWVRYVREGDFRASGGHDNHADKHLFSKDIIQYGFDVSKKLNLQSCALDIVKHKDSGELYLIENSYCYGVDEDEFDHGYWDSKGEYHDEKFNGFDWMIECVIKEFNNKQRANIIKTCNIKKV